MFVDYNQIRSDLKTLIKDNLDSSFNNIEEEADFNHVDFGLMPMADVRLVRDASEVRRAQDYFVTVSMEIEILAADLSSFKESCEVRDDRVNLVKDLLRDNPDFSAGIEHSFLTQVTFSSAQDEREGHFIASAVISIDITLFADLGAIAVALSGTAIAGGVLESEIVTGGETIIYTLTNDTWVATIGDDNATTTAFLAGLTGSLGEFEAEVALVHGNLVRTSSTVLTLTLPAASGYDIPSDETLTHVIPASAFVNLTSNLTPDTILVSFEPEAEVALTGTVIAGGVLESEIVAGGETIIYTVSNDTWVATIGDDNSITTDFLAGITGNDAGANGWDNEVALVHGDLVRTSATVLTLTLPATAGYQIDTNETLTHVIPASAFSDRSTTLTPATIAVTAEDETATEIGDVPGIIAHWDFDNAATITLNGGDIARCDDQITTPELHDLHQSTPSRQPTLSVAGLNGLDAASYTNGNGEEIASDNASGGLDNFWDGGGWAIFSYEFDPAGTTNFANLFSFANVALAIRGEGASGKLELQTSWSGDPGRWQTAAGSSVENASTVVLIEYNSDDPSNNPTVNIDGTDYTIGSGLTENVGPPTGTINDSSGESIVKDGVSTANLGTHLTGELALGAGTLSSGNRDFLLNTFASKWVP